MGVLIDFSRNITWTYYVETVIMSLKTPVVSLMHFILKEIELYRFTANLNIQNSKISQNKLQTLII